MTHPGFLLVAAAAGLFALVRGGPKKTTTSEAQPMDLALIDAGEKQHPNAPIAQRAIAVALNYNSLTIYENTAIALESQLGMPKTATNLRTWATMAKQGGNTVAGDDDEVGAELFDDEVGAARRRVKKLFKKAAAKKAKPKPKAKRAAAASESEPGEDLSDFASDGGGPDFASDGGGDDDDDNDVGAGLPRKRLPEWMRFLTTQSKLAGDPGQIEATATVMRRMGYHRAAKIHLQTAKGA